MKKAAGVALSTLAATAGVPALAGAASAAADTPGEAATELIVQGSPGDPVVHGATVVDAAPSATFTVQGQNLAAASQYNTGAWLSVVVAEPGGTQYTLSASTGMGGGAFVPGQMVDIPMENGPTAGLGVTGESSPGASVSQFRIDQITSDAGGAITGLELSLFASAPLTIGSEDTAPVTAVLRVNATGALPADDPSGEGLAAPVGTVGPLSFQRGGSLVVGDASGTNGRAVASGLQGRYVHSAWSPNGAWLVRAEGNGASGLLAERADGSQGTELVNAPGIYNYDGSSSEPAISPDGSTVVYVPNTGVGNVGHLSAVAIDGSQAGRPTTLDDNVNVTNCYEAHTPAFAPDGNLFYACSYLTGPGPEVFQWKRSGPTVFIHNAKQPAFSPDDQRIAFVRPDGRGRDQVFTVGRDGVSGLRQVTFAVNGANNPSWSPDGRTLAYHDIGYNSIVEIPAAGGAAVGSIPNADDPAWTPSATVRVTRQWGQDRVGTAIAASQYDFARAGDSSDRERDQAQAVVLSRSDNYADALAGSALAVRKNGPLLVTPPTSLSPSVLTEIHRVLPSGGRVYLLGGTAALSPAIESQLRGLGYGITRLAGDDRFATAVQITKAIDPHPRTVLIASGANFPDALAAGATGEPLVLTNGTTMPAATASYLNSLDPVANDPNGVQLVSVGGPGDKALISGYQSGKMPHWPHQISRVPLIGKTRTATALLVATSFFSSPSDVAVATASTWPDALSGGAMVGHRGGPLLLTDSGALSPGIASYLSQESASIWNVDMLGGTAALSNALVPQIQAVIGTPGHTVYRPSAPGGPTPDAGRVAPSGNAVLNRSGGSPRSVRGKSDAATASE